jgi:hypothetical protein
MRDEARGGRDVELVVTERLDERFGSFTVHCGGLA